MANRIQLRRDTAANWTRVNPVLEDGEPGLEIDTNRIKYGDGNTTWANLSYAGGGSVSFDYSTVQEGLDGLNQVTSITGGNNTGVGLTSEQYAQLLWVPDTDTVTIADINDGPAGDFNWAFVDDSGLTIQNKVSDVSSTWQFTTNGNLQLPLGGKIYEAPSPTFVGNAVVILPGNGGDPNQLLQVYPTQNEGNHLHLTSGNLAVTDIFLGDDDQYIRTRTDGGMTIGTGGGEMWGGWAWTFGANAVLSVPYEGLIRATDDSISLQTHDTVTNVTHGVRLGTSGSLFLENATNNVQWLQIDTFAGNTRFQSNGGASIKTDSGGSEWSWLFANTGVLTTPGNVQVGTTGTYGNISFVDTIQANNYVYANGVSILSGLGGGGAADRLTNGGSEVVLQANGVTTFGNTAIISNNGEFRIWADNDITVYRNGQDGYGIKSGNIENYTSNTLRTVINSSGLEIKTGNLIVGNAVVGAIETTDSVDLYGNSNAEYVQINWNNQNFVYVDSTGAHMQAGPSAPGQYEIFLSTDGSTTFPDHKSVAITGNLTVGNLIVTGNSSIINTESYVVSDNIIQMANANPADTLDLGFVAHRTVNSTLQHTGLVRDSSAGVWKLFSNVVTQPGGTVDFAGVVYDDLQLDKLFADTVHLTGTAPASAVGAAGDQAGDIHVDSNYLYYCTTDYVALSYTVGWEGSVGNTFFLTKGDYPTPQAGWTVTYQSFGPYTIQTVTDNGTNWQLTVDGNLGSPSGGTATLTNPTQPAIWKSAPLTAFRTAANSIAGNLTTGNVSATQYNFANGVNILSTVVGNYSNANVAAYLLTYINANVANLNATSGNITTLAATNFSSGNIRVSGGFISALTNASITTGTIINLNSTNGNATTLVASNFSTANAVVTGGYVTGLANITVTGNATVGNLIGTSPNTTIVAGSYSSAFLNNGMAAIGGNIAVTGNVTASGIAPFYAPNRPAFRVYGTVGTQIVAPTTVSSTHGVAVDYNQGSYYDNTTGIFTAPVPGLYHAYATLRVGSNNGLNQATIVKNNSTSGANVIAFWETDTNIGSATHFAMTGYASMVAGDTLRLRVLSGNVNLDTNDSWGVTYIG